MSRRALLFHGRQRQRPHLIDAIECGSNAAVDDPLTQSDRRFVQVREARRSFGLYVLPGALVGCAAVWFGLWAFVPLLMNPFEAVKRMEQQQLEPGTLTTLASLGAVAFNLVFVVLVLCLFFALAWARHERRYQRLLHKQQQALEAGRQAERLPG